MKSFTVFDTSTGRILRTGTCLDEDFAAQTMSAGESVMDSAGAWATQYVLDGVLKARPACTVVLAEDAGYITLSGVQPHIWPQLMDETGAEINLLGFSATDDGSPITVAIDSGSYTIVVDQFPQLLFSQQITIP